MGRHLLGEGGGSMGSGKSVLFLRGESAFVLMGTLRGGGGGGGGWWWVVQDGPSGEGGLEV